MNRINPANTVVVTFAEVLPEAIRHYRQNYSRLPDFLVIDWKGEDGDATLQQARASARLISITDKHLVATRNLCLFPKATRIVLDPRGLDELLQAVLAAGFGPQVQVEAVAMRNVTRWRPNLNFVATRQHDIDTIYDALADEESRENFLRVVKMIATGDPGYLKVSPYEQYQHPLVRPARGDAMVEGGVLNGYTTNKFAAEIGPDGKIIAFEPLSEAHRVSRAATAHHPNVVVEHLGLWSKKSEFYIENRGGGSRLVTTPNANTETCQCVDLDSYARENTLGACDIIKLDIEGAEEDCIKGALATIQKYRPKLQIALYHTPAHYLDIMLLLMRENLGYKFYLGHHLAWYWETILYALPDETDRSEISAPAGWESSDDQIDHQEFLRTFQKTPVQEVPNACSSAPVVTVIVTAYNHARFIAQTLDSMLAQQTDFPFEICISEDNSTDGTRAICLEYAQKHPQKIRLFLGDRANNIIIEGKPTGRFNLTNMLLGARGRYVALCDGDDYWTSPNKLAKQVAFLESHDDFSACFHNGHVVWEGTDKRLRCIVEERPGAPLPPRETYFRSLERHDFSTTDLLRTFNFIPTASLMFRASNLRRVPRWFFDVLWADFAIASLLSRGGNKIKFLNFDGCVYRKHSGGITAGDSPLSVYFNRKLIYTHLNRTHGYRFDREFSALAETHRKITLQWLSSAKALPSVLVGIAQKFVATEQKPITSLRESRSVAGLEIAPRPANQQSLSDPRPPKIERFNLPVVLVRSHAFNYSETFIEDHVNHLSRNLTLLYGYPFPRFAKEGRSVLPSASEQKLQTLGKAGSTLTPELWDEYSTGLAEFFKNSGARVALVESGLMGAFVHEACEKAGLPYVVHFHGLDAYGNELLSQWQGHYRKFFQNATKLVVVSKAMRAQLLKLGAPAERIVLAPYGVSVDVPALAQPANAGPCFLAVGRFVEKKAPHLTLQAFAAVHQRVPAARLTMVGDGPLLEVCQQWAKDNGIGEAVTFAGVQSREQVSHLMASSRAFVQHSITAANGDSEGLPLAVLEAGAHGLPVVATRHAGIPDAVTEGVHGYLVAEKDVKQMAERMIALAEDAALAGRMGAAYRERIVAEFSRQLSLDRLRGILADAANAKGAAPASNPKPQSAADVQRALTRIQSADDALALAEIARGLGDLSLVAECLQTAIGLDRNCRSAYLQLGQILAEAEDEESAYLCLEEARRLAPLEGDAKALSEKLEAGSAPASPMIRAYQEQIGSRRVETCSQPRRILVVSNLFPPQELGGYGRTMWEFCDLLTQRGHDVKVLTSNATEWHRAPDPGMDRLEPRVERTLRLFGSWVNGGAVANPDQKQIVSIAHHNLQVVSKAIAQYQPDSVLAGNLDFIGHAFIEEALARGLPVLHRLGNAGTSYPIDPMFENPRFCLAGNTKWLNKRLQDQGYRAGNWAVVYPGSPLEHYYRAFAPRFDTLRLAYASIFAPFKGPQVMFEALGKLTRANIPFTLECAGETPAPEFRAKCEAFARAHGFADRIRWHGFMNRDGLAAMFSRCNTLIFPSVFEEPFGKTQIEAMAAGLAVVSSGTGGTREIVQHMENGLIFQSNTPDDLARQLTVLHNDKELWAKLAAQGQTNAFRFTSLESVRRIEEFFQRFPSARGPKYRAILEPAMT